MLPFWMNAQIVNIPDANFKAKLLQASQFNSIASNNPSQTVSTYCSIDTNGDGQIQVSEASVIRHLDISNSNITSLEGINSFVNLISLYCGNNSLVTLDVSSLTSLIYFSCYNNQISILNISGLTNLQRLYLSNNQINNLNLNGYNSLFYLYCDNNLLTNLNVNGLSSLVELNCSNNNLTSLNLNGVNNLQSLHCSYNPIVFSNIIFGNLNSLLTLSCSELQLTILDVSGFVNLQNLYCSHNQLVSIVTGMSLKTLDCSYNPISLSNINFVNPNLLITLRCEGLSLTTLNVVGFPNLVNLICNYNQLTSLDLSNSPKIRNLECENNQLTSLNIKNGNLSWIYLYFQNNPNLSYVCADEEDLTLVQQKINLYGYTNCQLSSYCSFTPGGNYNTITGSMLFDADNNGCDTNDSPQPNIKININDGTNQGATFTNNTANYNFYTQTGNFTVTPNIENPSWFTFSPSSATIPFADNNNNVVTQNFCISANGVHPDVEIVIAPITPARPGFDAIYQIVYKNKGNQALSGNITFTYDDEILDFVTAFPLTDTQSLGLLNWNYQNLQPFESRSIYVSLNVNSPQETPAVNIDDVLSFQATITPVIGDDLPEDNLFSYNQTVVGSFDPNDITCIEGEVVPPSEIGEYLHYIINFENTGTAEAENIVVKVDIDESQFDIDSLQMLNTSHNAYIRQADNKIEFIFQEIWLDTGGHGNVLLKIKSKNNLLEGDTVAKQANIYFDYNAPIETNMANTTFEILSNGNFEIDESITIFPNPTASIININCNNAIKTVELYDVQGRLLQTQIVESATTSLNLSDKTNGIYFAKITSENGVKVEKISKE